MSSNSVFAVLALIACILMGVVIGLQSRERGDYIAAGCWPNYALSQ